MNDTMNDSMNDSTNDPTKHTTKQTMPSSPRLASPNGTLNAWSGGPSALLSDDVGETKIALAQAFLTGQTTDVELEEATALLNAEDPAFLEALSVAEYGLPLLVQSMVEVAPPESLKASLFEALNALEPALRPVEQLPTPPDNVREHGAAATGDTSDDAYYSGPVPSAPVVMHVDSDMVGLTPVIENIVRRSPPAPVSSKAPRKALLVVDMLHDYVDKDSPMEIPLARSIVPALKRRLEQARAEGIPVIFINDVHDDDDPDFQVWPKHAVRGTRGAEVIPPLRPRAEEYAVDRISYSAFFETKLEAILTELGVTDLILCGQAADACVMMTGVDALMRGFHIEVPEDSVAGTTEEGKVFALRRLALLKPYGDRRRRD